MVRRIAEGETGNGGSKGGIDVVDVDGSDDGS